MTTKDKIKEVFGQKCDTQEEGCATCLAYQLIEELEAENQKTLEAFAQQIMDIAHKESKPAGTYDTVSTHAIAVKIKSLLPTFSYHKYRADLAGELVKKAVEEERIKVLTEVRNDKWPTYEAIDRELQTLNPTNK